MDADGAMPASRWREVWNFLRRIEAAAAQTPDELRDARLDRHEERLAALEGRLGAPPPGAQGMAGASALPGTP